MKSNWIIYGVLGISLITNFVLFSSDKGDNTVACDNKGRYDNENGVGALGISKEEGRDLVMRYRDDYPPGNNNNHPTGFVFTKKMFDEIFEDQSVNSVTLDLVTYNENISLVVKGYNYTSTKLAGDSTSKVYVIQSFCPVDCSVW